MMRGLLLPIVLLLVSTTVAAGEIGQVPEPSTIFLEPCLSGQTLDECIEAICSSLPLSGMTCFACLSFTPEIGPPGKPISINHWGTLDVQVWGIGLDQSGVLSPGYYSVRQGTSEGFLCA